MGLFCPNRGVLVSHGAPSHNYCIISALFFGAGNDKGFKSFIFLKKIKSLVPNLVIMQHPPIHSGYLFEPLEFFSTKSSLDDILKCLI